MNTNFCEQSMGCVCVFAAPPLFQTVMNTTRTVFGKHHDGYIFPILLNVKPLEYSFAGVIAELQTPEQFICFSSKTFIITAATRESHRLLGVSRPSAVCGCVSISICVCMCVGVCVCV